MLISMTPTPLAAAYETEAACRGGVRDEDSTVAAVVGHLSPNALRMGTTVFVNLPHTS